MQEVFLVAAMSLALLNALKRDIVWSFLFTERLTFDGRRCSEIVKMLIMERSVILKLLATVRLGDVAVFENRQPVTAAE